MTDELSIQNQRPSALPYALGGAAVGTGAGFVANATIPYLKGKQMTPEDLIKEMNDKDKFESHTKADAPEADAWRDLKAKQDAVNAAEAELKVAEKGTSPEIEQALNNLNGKKEELNTALENLKNSEINRLKNGNTSGSTTRTAPLDFDKLSITGTNAERTRLQNEYNNLRNAYDRALQRVDNTINAGLGANRTATENSITGYLDREYGRYSSKTEEELAEIFGKKTETTGILFKTERPTAQYQRALDEAANVYPDFTRANLTGEHYLQFGQQIERGTVIPRGYTPTTVTITDPVTHRPKTISVMYKDADLVNFVKQESERIANQRIAYADELFNSARESVMLKQKLGQLPTDFAARVEKGLANSTGLYTAASGTTPEVFNFNQIINESRSRVHSTRSGRGRSMLTGYDADIKTLKDAIKNAASGTTPVMPTTLNGSYATTDVQKALDMAHARKSIAEKFGKEQSELVKEIQKCISSNSILADFDAQIAAYRANDAGLQKAKEKFVAKFPEVFGKPVSAATLSEAEIIAKAEEYAEKNVRQSLKDDVAKLKQLYEDALAKGGNVDKAALEAAQGKVNSAKGELEKAAKTLGEKYTMGGKAKWIAPVVGAVALGLAGLAFRPGSKEA